MTGTPGFPGFLWCLEGFLDESRRLRRIPILSLPFEIGRRPDQGLTLHSDLVSQRHAVIFRAGRRLKLRDLESTNGTLVNRRPVRGEIELAEGDILHFAQHEFRLDRLPAYSDGSLDRTRAVTPLPPRAEVERSRGLRELLRAGAVFTVFQPILALADGRLLGYEALGRGASEGSSTSDLFDTAATLGAEAELSRLFRRRCLDQCSRLPPGEWLFINTHPAEIGAPELGRSLRELRERAPELQVVLEVHEAAVTSPRAMTELGARLTELGMRLAYDDFGAGQARLRELAEATPDYLKFDRSLIQGIDRAPQSRHGLLRSLVTIAADLGIETVAEGLENDGEAVVCRELGFDFGQGLLYGAPLESPVGVGAG